MQGYPMPMKPRRRHPRKTIGVLTDWTVDSYQQALLSGIMETAKARKANCVVFEGGGLGSPDKFETQRNGIYQLASGGVVDGLILLSASIAHFIGDAGVRAFCAPYRPLPLVSISLELDDATSVLVENRTGMRALVEHLVERHRYRRFGFVKGRIGDHEAEERFNAFLEVLREHEIRINPRFVVGGDYTVQAGIDAAKQFLQEGIGKVDAIVASNDNMALGLMEELGRNGIPIPGRVAVTGFDDFDMADYLSPPLTTVRLPIFEQGATAARLLIDKLEHKEVPSKVYVPTRMVIRESCRCLPLASAASAGAAALRKTHTPPTRQTSEEDQADFRDWLPQLLVEHTDIDPVEITRLLEQVWKTGGAGGNPNALDDFFRQAVFLPLQNSIAFSAIQKMLAALWRRRSLGIPADPLETTILDRLFEAVMTAGRKVVDRESTQFNTLFLECQQLGIIRELMFTMDLDRQMDVLARRLPDSNIRSCYLSVFRNDADQDRRKALCLLGIRDGVRIDGKLVMKEFPATRLVPDDFLDNRERRAVIVEALKDYGFIVFEMGEKPNIFFAYLSDILSGSVQGARMYKELEAQKNDLDRNLARIRKAMGGFIQTMSATVEARDPYTAGHQRRVSDLARTIAREMKLSPAMVESVRMAGIIHDLGKIYIPAEILNRAGILDDIEWKMIKRHPQVAWEILKNIDFPWPIAEIVHQHHERLNGKGYPNGLKGNAISLEARILAVADVVEAMSSHRPYREALGIEKALEEINKYKGSLYDSRVVDVCTDLFRNKGYMFRTTDYSASNARKS
jgi:putative nucleotidyltransferase with HDIG domain